MIEINKSKIGPGHPTYIVAELSANHEGDLSKAIKSIEAIKKSGANAVKLQTYTADCITIDSNKNDFLLKDSSKWGNHKNLHRLFSSGHTPFAWHREIFEVARELDLDIFSSPFSEEAVDLLESLSCPVYKVASAEINHTPLLKKIASTGKPVILSTGLALLGDIEEAINILSSNGSGPLALLKCTTQYPADPENLNLLNIIYLRDKFRTVVGFSDHSLGVSAALAAVALGAEIVEKHFVLDSSERSLDGFFSMKESEFSQFVEAIRLLEKTLGVYEYTLPSLSLNEISSRRSIYAFTDIKIGECFSKNNIKVVRPGYGLAPKYYELLIGKKAKRNLGPGDRIELSDLV